MTITKKIIAATLAVSTLTGAQAPTFTAAIGTAVAVSAITATPAEAAVVCRDEPIDTRGSKSRMFQYQPMKKKGLFGKCRKAGSVREIKMLIPRLPAGVKRTGSSRMNQPNGCSGGGIKGRRLFHAACNAHDICYQSLGVPKFKCEDMFLSNMLKISKHGPIGSRVKATAFVSAVGVGARSNYNDGQAWARRNYTAPSH